MSRDAVELALAPVVKGGIPIPVSGSIRLALDT